MVQKDLCANLLLFVFSGSIIVNPWNTEELANAIHEAVTMPEHLRKSNFQKLYRYVTKYTAANWGTSFVNELKVVICYLQPEFDFNPFFLKKKMKLLHSKQAPFLFSVSPRNIMLILKGHG